MKKLLLIIFLFIMTQDGLFAQFSVGIPVSFRNNNTYSQNMRSSISANNLPALDNSNLTLYADSIANLCDSCPMKRFYGYGIENSINIKTSAQHYNSSIENGKLWIYKVSSATAKGFQFYFDHFKLPKKSFLHIYNSDRSHVLGPYTSYNSPEDTNKLIQFGTPPIMSNEVFIEYFESDSAEFNGIISIANIVHIFSNIIEPAPGESGLCQKDVGCKTDWAKEINSVALILYYNPVVGLSGLCSGTLINNTSQDGTPYFLTAAHCQSTPSSNTYNTSTWQFIFDYQRKDCFSAHNAPAPDYQKVIYGSDVLSADMLDNNGRPLNSDYLLLKLFTTPLEIENMYLCYSGWTTKEPLSDPSFSSNSEFTIIHHPNADVKKISVVNSLDESAYGIGVAAKENFFTSEVIYGGEVEPGSSGSAVYNQYHQIVATSEAKSGNNPCDFPNYLSLLSKFSKHWSNSTGELMFYLDPNSLTSNSAYNGPLSYCPYPAGTSVGIGGPIFVGGGGSSSQSLNSGFKINGKAGVPILCSTTTLTLTPLVASRFSTRCYNKEIDCWGFFDPPIDFCTKSSFFGLFPKCTCWFTSYQVDIEELNYDLSSTGNVKTRVYERKEQTLSSSIPQININLNDFGVSLTGGKFYKIGLGSNVDGYWDYSSRIMYVLPDIGTVYNANNVGSNIYASNNLTIVDSYVLNDIEAAATDYIVIKPNAVLKGGRYFIDIVNCSTFNRFGHNKILNENKTIHNIPINNLSSSYDYNFTKPIDKVKNIESPVLIYPNPVNDNLILQLPISDFTGLVIVKIYNSSGQIVLNEKKPFGEYIGLNSEGLITGFYNIQIEYENKIINSRFIKKQQ